MLPSDDNQSLITNHQTMKINHIRRIKNTFCSIRHIKQLAALVKTPAYQLQLMAIKPEYNCFGVPKKDGSQRWIEDPEPALKKVQRQLNHLLQCTYFFRRTDAAYGFLMNPDSDPEPRNIKTNAERHLGCQWLFNADIADFFHQVEAEQVRQIFLAPPFGFKTEIAALLMQLTTFKGRLPMGAPTSPILSNFGSIEMDKDLSDLAKWEGWIYTRFADDMSFSSQQPFPPYYKERITQVVHAADYTFNQTKFKLMSPDATKTVTGLVLKGTQVDLPEGFLTLLKADIGRLQKIMEVQNRYAKRSQWVDDFIEKTEGKLTFASFILGEMSQATLDLRMAFNDALTPPKDDFGTLSWLDFPYLR